MIVFLAFLATSGLRPAPVPRSLAMSFLSPALSSVFSWLRRLSASLLLCSLLGLLLWLAAPQEAWAASDQATGVAGSEVRGSPQPLSGPIHVVGRLSLNLSPEQQRVFEQKTIALAAITRSKDAVSAYSCNRDIEEDGLYLFDEIWPSQQALEDHLKTDHFLAWWDWVQPHLAQDLDVELASLASFHRL